MSEIADLYNESYHSSFKKTVEENKQLKQENEELKEVLKEFDIVYARDEDTGNLYGRCNKLYKAERKLEKILNLCEPILSTTTLDKLQGAEFDGKYILAKQIKEIVEDKKNE